MQMWRDTGFVQDSDEDTCVTDVDESSAPTAKSREKLTIDNALEQEYYLLVESGDEGPGQHASGFANNGPKDPKDKLQKPGAIASVQVVVDTPHSESVRAVESHLGDRIATARLLPENNNTAPSPSSSELSELQSPLPYDDAHTESGRFWPPEILDEFLVAPASTSHRTFRKRNPIQLHPYRLEIEKYKRTLKARGIRPVQVVVGPQQQTASGEHGFESDNGTIVYSQESFVERELDELDIHETRTVDHSPSPPPADPVSLRDDELPDITSLLSTKPLKLSNGKRRRLSPSIQSRRVAALKAPAGVSSRLSEPENDVQMFDFFGIPISPPRSSPPTKRVRGGLMSLQQPVPPIPAQPPSPATSSPVAKSPDSDGSGRPSRSTTFNSHPSTPAVEVSSSDISSCETDEEDPHEAGIRTIKRRIKGVLPASWLKLDQQAQQNPDHRASTRKSLGVREIQRGVAQKVSGRDHASRAHIRHLPSPQALASPHSDADNQAEDGYPVFGAAPRPQSTVGTITRGRYDEDPGSIMEDDFIDPMLQSAKQQRRSHRRSGHKQRRLTDQWGKQVLKSRSGERGQGIGQRQVERKEALATRVSIIDRVPLEGGQNNASPQFLRIAARTASCRADLGRHSPTRKLIRLATRADSLDASITLSDWKQGKVQPNLRRQRRLRPSQAGVTKTTRNWGRDTLLISAPSRQSSVERQRADCVTEKHRMPKTLTALEHPRPSRSSGPVASSEQSRRGFEPRDAGLQLLTKLCDQAYVRKAENSGSRSLVTVERARTLRQPLRDLSGSSSLNALQSKSPSHQTKPSANDQIISNVRKQRPQRLDVETHKYRQPDESWSIYVRKGGEKPQASSDHSVLLGLEKADQGFPHTFDIWPLQAGTYMHTSTFIGSGSLQKCLVVNKQATAARGVVETVQSEDSVYHWTMWNEERAASFSGLFDRATAALGAETLSYEPQPAPSPSSVAHILETIIAQNNTGLWFADDVDRSAYVRFLEQKLETLFQTTIDNSHRLSHGKVSFQQDGNLCRILALQLAMSGQAVLLRGQEHFTWPGTDTLAELVRKIASVLMSQLLSGGSQWLHDFYEDNRRHLRREAGIRSDQPGIQEILILYHVLDKIKLQGTSFWNIYNTLRLPQPDDIRDIFTLETFWLEIVALLPLLEIGSSGILQANHRFEGRMDNWDAIRVLLLPPLSHYKSLASRSGTFINKYVRATIARCHWLVREWGWSKCDIIIGTFFDFFASNGLMPLSNETTHGSPSFLRNLASDEPELTITSNENAFHMFLKLLATGMRGFPQIYSDKKIQSIAWRWIPNHGRTYPKDKPLQEQHLDALRNHHDLLSVLYWSSPTGFRLRVALIQSLIDHKSSHREACRLNMRCWTNLATFHVAKELTSESSLNPFISWFADIVDQNITQYKLAHTEAEASVAIAQRQSNVQIPEETLRSIIRTNQSHIISILTDAAVGMRDCLGLRMKAATAFRLLRDSNLLKVFGLFDPCNLQLSQLLLNVSNCVRQSFVLHSGPTDCRTIQGDVDSQDYGEWPEMEIDNVDREVETVNDLSEFFIEESFHLLSNVIGSESCPTDGLCHGVVQTWVDVAAFQVQNKRRDWGDFIDEYGALSWTQLRRTRQWRTITPLFFSTILTQSPSAFIAYSETFVSTLLTSLVERESVLKYQHTLLTAMIHAEQTCGQDRLLVNLPFVGSHNSPPITLQLLRERRIAVLSMILDNMRRIMRASAAVPNGSTTTKSTFAKYLKQMMASMKTNYLELTHDGHNGGTYVTFVQTVVGFIQQYASDFCPVDPFFIDSANFPLPASDPTYVVGKLKSYSGKLSEAGSVKQLASFVQNSVIRAVLDQQQVYVKNQLLLAATDMEENLQSPNFSLQATLLEVVFPPYLRLAVRTSAGWLFATPIVQACSEVFARLLSNDGFTVSDVAERMATNILNLLHSLVQDLQALLGDADRLRKPHIVRFMRELVDMVAAAAGPLDLLTRLCGGSTSACQILCWFESFSRCLVEVLSGVTISEWPEVEDHELSRLATRVPDIMQYGEGELCKAIDQIWVCDGTSFFYRQVESGQRHPFPTDILTFEQEKESLFVSVASFWAIFEAWTGEPHLNDEMIF